MCAVLTVGHTPTDRLRLLSGKKKGRPGRARITHTDTHDRMVYTHRSDGNTENTNKRPAEKMRTALYNVGDRLRTTPETE